MVMGQRASENLINKVGNGGQKDVSSQNETPDGFMMTQKIPK